MRFVAKDVASLGGQIIKVKKSSTNKPKSVRIYMVSPPLQIRTMLPHLLYWISILGIIMKKLSIVVPYNRLYCKIYPHI